MNDEEPLAPLFKPSKEQLDTNATLASKFIKALFAPYEGSFFVDFRSLYPHWSEEFQRGQNRDDEVWSATHSMSFVRAPAEEVIAEYIRRHAWSKDCYFGVLPRAAKSGKLESITQAAWLWCDIDAKTGGNDAAMAVLMSAMDNSLPCPSIITDSRNGIHCYWPLSEVIPLPTPRARQVFTSVLKGLASWIGSFGDVKADPAVTNVNAILRISGSYNLKKEFDPFHVVSFSPPARSEAKSYAWWQANIPGWQLPVEYKPREARQESVASKFKTTKRGQELLDNPPASDRHNALKIILGGSVYYGNGADVLDEIAIQFSSSSGLPQAEALRLARHFDRQRNGH